MKIFKILTSIAILFFIITACSNNESSNSNNKPPEPQTMKMISVEELEKFFEDEKTGFLVVTNLGDSEDADVELYLAALEAELDDQGTTALRYDVYKSNGKDMNTGKTKHINPTSDYTKTENLHFVKNGQVMGVFDLTRYEGEQLQPQLEYFISLMKKYIK